MRIFLVVFVLFFGLSVSGQTYSVNGNVFDEKGQPMKYSTAVLLNPQDSTLEFYAITNSQGQFELKNVKKGKFLLQIAFLGFQSIYKEVSVPLADGSNIGTFVMNAIDIKLGEVTVSGDYVPLRIKKDTIEFNANAFKTKEDAVVEDLLKKLPGVKVDRAGNIKAMGEDVNKLLVDGKEFFGNDPKVATKNIPANAVDKVQLYNKKSDESEFTGVDDGVRNKTINLLLKENKKNAVFGDVVTGYGTADHYKASAKAYRFSKNKQFAALGMINNINQFGFSFGDYINFTGGIANMMHGGGSAKIKITSDNSFPVNFGQPVIGLTTSGAGGINYSQSKDANNRFFISYLANGSNKDLDKITNTRNYTKQGAYSQLDTLGENTSNYLHQLNFGLRNRIDSSQNIIVNGGLSYTYGTTNSLNYSKRIVDDALINALNNNTINDVARFSGNVSGTYQKIINNNRTILKLSAYGSYSNETDNYQFDNGLWSSETGWLPSDNQYQNNKTDNINYSAKASLTQKLGKHYFLEPFVQLGNTIETLNRIRGILVVENEVIDSLSPEFEKNYQWIRPGINIKRNTEKTQFTLGLQMESGKLNTKLWEAAKAETKLLYFTPRLSYEYEYKTGRRLAIFYESEVNTPTTNQLLPVLNTINPLSTYYGNPDLKPEYSHDFNIQWLIFDQFSFTSLMISMNGNYIHNKINWKSTINENLEQSSTLVNVSNEYSTRANIDFSTPIKKLGIKIDFSVEESWNQGTGFINDVENKTTNFSHRFSLSVENRKKKKWDLITGAGVTLRNSSWSLQSSLNKQYFDVSWFGEIRYNPTEHWNFELTADITDYTDLGFDASVQIPLIGAEINYNFMKNNRAMLSLNAFDLLNQNTGIERLTELNYLRVIQSSIIGRYVILSLKFRLNKFGDSGNGIDIKMKRR